ncbi:deoxyribodipyrimidine photo-lyase [Calditerrivibrio nitroreducens]|uniref:Deoxyribodipyrimidine photo-lyase n=1 Tax=Calditerrivibrio nitroreducens (strain DSM 19672 / NBRC 101217 / Yu37-1) TaxID=768670 RepID=E4TIC8_CALNY|nr:Deoxyribodipyrimidine photo-lyase [Calditerrivibrio nitroreducens DSM 19672]
MNYLERVRQIKKSSKKGDYILYWMQGAFRVEYNHSLEFAKYLALSKDLPLKVLVVVDFNYKDANYRHFKFFIDGILELIDKFKDLKISFHVKIGSFKEIVPQYSKNADTLITDKAYIKWLKDVRNEIYNKNDITIYEVDTNLMVPVQAASPKCEYGAYTIRPKIHKLKEKFLNDFVVFDYKGRSYEVENDLNGLNIDDKLKSVHYLKPVDFIGGESKADKLLRDFLNEKYLFFAEKRGDPSLDVESNLSFYLHFGFISPIKILKEAIKIDTDPKNYETLFEQLVVRRELAHNFTYYCDNISDLFSFLPNWAVKTVIEHKDDIRKYLYKLEDLENFKTHDKFWNAAQYELIHKGKIHNYMRMYWGKKVIEWTESFEDAYKILIYLNDKYALDGRDPNGYAGIAWCFGMHDRAFQERKIFGKVRYMSENGLKQKFDMDGYLSRVMG